MKDTIEKLDTSILLGIVVLTVGILAGFDRIGDTTLLFFTNLVTYVMGKNSAKI